ncbi:hypothetical protein TIFTF001_027730 [Ficus carica]|uniref:Uncharacterized protein n=1 Tax=Ficus carica TaxID=3494 RepID=A0AA88DNH3_FICCA|nr:hypothetical protein TIFTF001_027730 [Ficus carica]
MCTPTLLQAMWIETLSGQNRGATGRNPRRPALHLLEFMMAGITTQPPLAAQARCLLSDDDLYVGWAFPGKLRSLCGGSPAKGKHLEVIGTLVGCLPRALRCLNVHHGLGLDFECSRQIDMLQPQSEQAGNIVDGIGAATGEASGVRGRIECCDRAPPSAWTGQCDADNKGPTSLGAPRSCPKSSARAVTCSGYAAHISSGESVVGSNYTINISPPSISGLARPGMLMHRPIRVIALLVDWSDLVVMCSVCSSCRRSTLVMFGLVCSQ